MFLSIFYRQGMQQGNYPALNIGYGGYGVNGGQAGLGPYGTQGGLYDGQGYPYGGAGMNNYYGGYGGQAGMGGYAGNGGFGGGGRGGPHSGGGFFWAFFPLRGVFLPFPRVLWIMHFRFSYVGVG